MTMNEVVDYERDFRRAKQGEALIYTKLHGLEADLSKPKDAPDFPEQRPQGRIFLALRFLSIKMHIRSQLHLDSSFFENL